MERCSDSLMVRKFGVAVTTNIISSSCQKLTRDNCWGYWLLILFRHYSIWFVWTGSCNPQYNPVMKVLVLSLWIRQSRHRELKEIDTAYPGSK